MERNVGAGLPALDGTGVNTRAALAALDVSKIYIDIAILIYHNINKIIVYRNGSCILTQILLVLHSAGRSKICPKFALEAIL